MPDPIRVLLVEDSDTDAFLIVRELQRSGFQVDCVRVQTHATMAAAIEAKDWDLVLSDWSMPQFSGPAALALCLQKRIEAPFIMVAGAVSPHRVAEILKAGALDFVSKDELARLPVVVKRELRAAQKHRLRKHPATTKTPDIRGLKPHKHHHPNILRHLNMPSPPAPEPRHSKHTHKG